MMIERLTEMGIDSVRQPSLADATQVPTQKNGTTRRRLQNQSTGEWFYSYCGVHLDYHPDCTTCHQGSWGY